MQGLELLKSRLRVVNDLESAASLLRWDQTTYMPPGGAEARGRQIATLSRLAHEHHTDVATGRALEAAEKETAGLPHDHDDAALARVARRNYDQAVKLPASLVEELNVHSAHSYQVWTEARPANDFERVRPLLEQTLVLSRRMADCFPGHAHPADPLIDFSDPGMTVATVRTLFDDLRTRLVPLVRAITSRPVADDSCLRQHAPAAAQLAFGDGVIRRFGFDFERGRQDRSPHPFMTKFSLGDVRITTRVREDDVTDALFSTLHECGHAMYEQGIRRELEGTPLAHGTSSGVHESQSRLWENLVGRSRGFWECFYPELRKAFPDALASVSLDTFYRAINRVERSLIRTDSDEVTYNLHVMLRFGLELDLLEGKLAVKDLARVWRERFEEDLGIPVPDDRDGVLQDVHWFAGPIGGAFQGYTLGNILSAQFYAAAVRQHPEIARQITQGEFGTLHGWLRTQLYQHGSKFTPGEVVQRATGQPMSVEPYLNYLWEKYQPIHGLTEQDRAGVVSH